MPDSVDAAYLVPTHLREGQSIGPVPVRTFFVGLTVGLLFAAPAAILGSNLFGHVGVWLGLVPLLIFAPIALPWFNPPAEHGAQALVMWLVDNLMRRFWPRVLTDVTVEGNVLYVPVGNWLEPRAVYRVSTINLATASEATRASARRRWGGLLNALPHAIQIVVRATPATALAVVERIRTHATPEAQDLAVWLTAHLQDAQLVDRERLLVVPAEDIAQLKDRCDVLEPAFESIGLSLARIASSAELRDLSGEVDMGKPLPATFMCAGAEYVRTFDLGELPPTIVTDWARPLLDGDLPVGASLLIEPLDVAWAKLKLDTRRNALESSSLTPGRIVAIEQVSALRMAYERRTTLPMRLTCTLQVRGADRRTLERRTKRLLQRCKELGAKPRLLRWEQRAGLLAGLAACQRAPRGRGLPVETGTIARTYPFSAGTLQLEGGVPFGVSGSAPVTFTTVQVRRVGRKGWRHMVWYGAPGSGKGFQLKVYLSREHFANGLRIYGIDQDEQGEYTGRFCDYLHGSSVPIRTLAAAEAFSFEDVPNPNVVLWDLHESEEVDRGRIFAELTRKLCAHLLATHGRAALVVDEAVTVTEDEDGRKALGTLNRRGRHFGVEVHVLTQRVTDWFDTQIGRTIQGTSANQWYGQLESRELHEMAPSMGLSMEEVDRIDRAGQGEGLLVTAGRRVWVTVYGHTSPGEFNAFNTDKDEDPMRVEERRDGQDAGLPRETATVPAAGTY
jgi:hypothetical protein